MRPTSEELEFGAKASQQVRIYEKYTLRNMRVLPCILGCCAVVALSAACLSPSQSQRTKAIYAASGIPFYVAIGFAQAVTAKKLYVSNKLILRLLEEKYGDSLPRVSEAKILLASSDLEEAIKHGTGAHFS